MFGILKLLQRPLAKRIRGRLNRFLPNHWAINYCLALPVFLEGNKRLPRRTDDPRASLNDIVFQRMIRNDWSLLQQACVDKELAKIYAQAKSKDVKVARTEAVMVLSDATTVEEVKAWLQPYFGCRLVVKPTHSCEAILYLDRAISDDALAHFVRYSKKNFFHIRRETQYRNLEHKLIVEENIAPATGLNDYKFSCANGRVLNGRVDIGRFTAQHRRALFSVPDFGIIPVRYGGLEIPDRIEPPKHLAEMINIASDLSRGFDFVRIDLYDIDGGVYFGEFTFTPCAGSSNYSDEGYAIELAKQLRASARPDGAKRSFGVGGSIDGALPPFGSPHPS
jgi:hypothetical protein